MKKIKIKTKHYTVKATKEELIKLAWQINSTNDDSLYELLHAICKRFDAVNIIMD